MNFKSHIKKHYQHQLARGMRHTSIFINVLPVTAVLFTDPRPCCFQPSAGLANSANKCGGSAKQAKCLPGWDQPGNPFPLSPNQDEKRDGAHERPCIRTWSPGCHLLLPAMKGGDCLGLERGRTASTWWSNPAAIHTLACCQPKLLCHMCHSFSGLHYNVQSFGPYWSNSGLY